MSEPSWWLGVVLAGAVINVLSSYLVRVVDQLRSKFSMSMRASSERKRAEASKRRLQMLHSRAARDFYATRALRARNIAVLFAMPFFVSIIYLATLPNGTPPFKAAGFTALGSFCYALVFFVLRWSMQLTVEINAVERELMKAELRSASNKFGISLP